jgi:hypothetical protein
VSYTAPSVKSLARQILSSEAVRRRKEKPTRNSLPGQRFFIAITAESGILERYKRARQWQWGKLAPLIKAKGAALDLAQSLLKVLLKILLKILLEILRVQRSPVEIAQVANVNGGHKLSPDLRATN